MFTIGIDLGGTNIAAGLCDENLNIIKKGSVRTGAHRSGEEIVRDMAALAKKLINEAGVSVDEVEYVGIATPGIANTARGSVDYSCNLPFVNFPIKEIFQKYFPAKEVYIANDANAAALAEALIGEARGTRDSLMLTLGTGVGGGIIIDGKIVTGNFNFAAGELGHMVIEHGGRPCGCGRRGCFEAYSSATALREITAEKLEEIGDIDTPLVNMIKSDGHISARTAFAAARMGDPFAKEVVDYYIAHLATGLTNYINIFQPEVLTIGGGISGEGDNLLLPLLEIVEREQYTRDCERKTRVAIARLKNDAGIIGAAGLGK